MGYIKELRQKCQAPRKHCDTWFGKNIARPISIYITVFFIRIGASANAVTGVFLFFGVFSAFFLIFSNKILLFLAGILFQIWYVLDHVDGEVARYRGKTSFTGIYFDHITHYIVHPLFFFCLGFGFFLKSGQMHYLLIAYISSMSIILISIIADTYGLILNKSSKEDCHKTTNKTKTLSLSRKVFSFFHKLCTFPVIISVFFVFTLVNLVTRQNIIPIFLWFYTICLFLIWSLQLSYIVLTRKIDKEISTHES